MKKPVLNGLFYKEGNLFLMLELDELTLYPLNAEEFSLWINELPVLEKKFGWQYCAEPMEGIFKDVVQAQLIQAMADAPDNWLWYTFWFIVRKADNKIIGSLVFKGCPSANGGDVEIGYGLGKEFEHKGYMTKSVKALCDWAKKQPDVKRIIAETEADGFASQRLLQRCGFSLFKKDSVSTWWELPLTFVDC